MSYYLLNYFKGDVHFLCPNNEVKKKKLKQLNIQINMGLIKQSKNLILTILLLFDGEVNLKNMGNMV